VVGSGAVVVAAGIALYLVGRHKGRQARSEKMRARAASG
jgi:hypothetical protein